MSEQRKRVAAITTVWRKDSHADVIIPKLLAGYDLDGQPVRPAVDVVSLYVDQVPENDLSRRWARRFGVPIYGSIEEALERGHGTLDVDAVLIVAEHGDYPWNERGQHLYPRREFFERATNVMRRAGRSVPLFNDKHLSYSWEHARWMYDTARALGMPFMAGSSLPVTFRDPALDLPPEAEVQEALVLSHGPTESYGFHALETLQCLVERRRGGETGVAAVRLLHGASFWRAWDASDAPGASGTSGHLEEARFPMDLYAAALEVARHEPGTAPEHLRAGAARRAASPGPQPPVAFLVRYADGLRATVLNLNGYVHDFAFAARLGDGTVVATAFKLEGQPPRWHFSFLAHHIEQFFLTGRPPYPVERTLLTTGTLAALMDSGVTGDWVPTPHLAITYHSPSAGWRRARGRSLPPEQVWGFSPDAV